MKRIIGYLMFLANSEGKGDVWYALKSKLCERFGVNDGYDIQYLEGKECYSCNGTGKFTKYSFGSGYKEDCHKCYSGWYKRPAYVHLERIRVGTHIFHKPIRREYSIQKLSETELPQTVTINGYIRHNRQKYGWLAFAALYLIFDLKGYIRFVKSLGYGWRCSWWLPKNYLYNFMHIKRNGLKSIPVRSFLSKFKRRATPLPISDELPF